MKRPFTVTFLGWLFIAVGLLALLYHLVKDQLDFWMVPIALVEIFAIVAGVFLIKGRNWARWLVLVWLAFHVIVSALNSLSASVPHFLLLVAVGYFLFTPPDSMYFGPAHED
ncbi:MAG: hypothetical protein WA789_05620 [Candidatus Acidiferrum sp.]